MTKDQMRAELARLLPTETAVRAHPNYLKWHRTGAGDGRESVHVRERKDVVVMTKPVRPARPTKPSHTPVRWHDRERSRYDAVPDQHTTPNNNSTINYTSNYTTPTAALGHTLTWSEYGMAHAQLRARANAAASAEREE